MEPSSGRPLHMRLSSRRKVQIVYYLHRGGGHVDHPHLIEGSLLPVQDGLRLKDFKNALAVLRGKSMPDAFSWSYKRSYKGSYIWQDLSDDDLIQPLQKHEYVLMGSELQNARPGVNACMCHGIHSESVVVGQREVVDTKLRDLAKEGYMNTSPSKDSPKKNLVQLTNIVGHELCPNAELNMRASMAGFSDCDMESVASMLVVHKPTVHVVSTMTDIPESLMTQNQRRSGEVKVYKAMETEQTTDAATQTGESKRCSTEECTGVNTPNPAPAAPSLQHHLSSSLQPMTTHYHNQVRRTPSLTSVPLDILGTLQTRPSLHAHNQGLCHGEQDLYYVCNGQSMSMLSVSNKSEMLYSPSSMHSSCTVQETVSPGSARSLRSINSMNSSRFSNNLLPMVDDQSFSSSNGGHNHGSHSAGATPSKVRLCSSSHLLKQLLSCSSVDISESSTLNLKSMSIHDHLPPTILSSRYHNEARGLHSSRNHHGDIAHRHGLQVEGETSPPMTPKSWLCHPCGAHSLCFTPSHGASYSTDHVRGLSREGSLKDHNHASTSIMNCSPGSPGSKRSSPFPQNLPPPQLSLNGSSGSRAGHLLYGS